MLGKVAMKHPGGPGAAHRGCDGAVGDGIGSPAAAMKQMEGPEIEHRTCFVAPAARHAPHRARDARAQRFRVEHRP